MTEPLFSWLSWAFLAVQAFLWLWGAVATLYLRCSGFLLPWLFLLGNMGSRARGPSRCCTWAQELWCAGLVALQHVGSSWTRDRTCVSFIGRQILNHWTTRQVCLYHYYFLIPFAESFLALPLLEDV